MVYMLDWNSGRKKFQIEWSFESNLRSSGFFKACAHNFFIKCLFFHQMIAHQKLWKMFFTSSKKLFSFSRYSSFVIFSLPFQTFQIQKGKRKWNNLWCYQLACINSRSNFWNNSKTTSYYIIRLGLKKHN